MIAVGMGDVKTPSNKLDEGINSQLNILLKGFDAGDLKSAQQAYSAYFGRLKIAINTFMPHRVSVYQTDMTVKNDVVLITFN